MAHAVRARADARAVVVMVFMAGMAGMAGVVVFIASTVGGLEERLYDVAVLSDGVVGEFELLGCRSDREPLEDTRGGDAALGCGPLIASRGDKGELGRHHALDESSDASSQRPGVMIHQSGEVADASVVLVDRQNERAIGSGEVFGA